ncbi:MAG: 2-succinyl-5-enolpyruvyl-6-hydroxy-3-cyclohexene-1-carboxylic-acid synthase [Gemmatimonadales bacterium]|nr:2-succinyl-5-enolpyruvyl-6-hydroxy-3-cyclohexene-1-carboxylic-acid synthase [Gemmatimonadales bacterium]
MKFDQRNFPNINALWSGLIMEELRRLGVKDLVVSPGSRNTPLIAAAMAAEGLRITPVVDERAAAYFALGCGKQLRPAAVVTTSGTAVMNLLPALTEARQAGVPLIVLSADRPPELRDCGANQAIDQLGPLQPIVKWQNDLPAPDDRLPARLVLTAVDQAVRVATSGCPGPVQLNCAFGDPLAPSESPWSAFCLQGTEKWRENGLPFVEEVKAAQVFDPALICDFIEKSERGLIVVGNTRYGEAVGRLAEKLNWPLIADPASSIRIGNCPRTLIRHPDLLGDRPRPDLLLQFGTRLISRKQQEWIDGLDCNRVLVDSSGDRMNPGHRSFLQLTAPVEIAARTIREAIPAQGPTPWLTEWQEMDGKVTKILGTAIDDNPELTEAFVTRQVAESKFPVFAGNSLPIRHLGQFATGHSLSGDVEANRGASGIDGVLATACGVANARQEPIVLLIGDLSLLHDLNSLGLAKKSRRKVIIVLLNNGGGGIFNSLPIADFPQVMTPLCDGDHDLEFGSFAAGFGLESWRCATRQEFTEGWRLAQQSRESCLVEVICDREDHGGLMERIIRERDRSQSD